MTAGRDMSLRVARMGDRRGRQRFAVVAEFGRRQAEVAARAVWAEPHYAESDLSNAPAISGTIAIVHRGGRTSFFDKARRAQAAGAVAVIVVNQDDRPFLAHHEAHEPAEGIAIPVVCVPRGAGEELLTSEASADGISLCCDPSETLTVEQFMVAREAEKESVHYENQEAAAQESAGAQASAPSWAANAAGAMPLGAQSWDFGVKLPTAPPLTPGGRTAGIQSWLQNARSPGLSPGLSPGSGTRWDLDNVAGDLVHQAKCQHGSPQWNTMSQGERDKATKLLYDAQRAQIFPPSAPPPPITGGALAGPSRSGLSRSCDWSGQGDTRSMDTGDVAPAGTPARRKDIERLVAGNGQGGGAAPYGAAEGAGPAAEFFLAQQAPALEASAAGLGSGGAQFMAQAQAQAHAEAQQAQAQAAAAQQAQMLQQQQQMQMQQMQQQQQVQAMQQEDAMDVTEMNVGGGTPLTQRSRSAQSESWAATSVGTLSPAAMF